VIAIAELPLADTLARPLRDLRISVTDRCQFRCTYCMPREVFGRDFAFLPRAELLTFEELTRLARVFAGLGVRKLRLTGGSRCCAATWSGWSRCWPGSAASRTSP
jgi:cyclic pyranopterin phosphate synthase